MATVKTLRRLNDKVLKHEREMMGALEMLSQAASSLYGEDLTANICNGSEIEFRLADDPDGLDGISIRLEDIIDSVEVREAWKGNETR